MDWQAVTVYASIGNSDDKLTQGEWSEYVTDFRVIMRKYADRIIGEWYSLPDSPYQNACMAIDIVTDDVETLRGQLCHLRTGYRQDSIAWASPTETEFL